MYIKKMTVCLLLELEFKKEKKIKKRKYDNEFKQRGFNR